MSKYNVTFGDAKIYGGVATGDQPRAIGVVGTVHTSGDKVCPLPEVNQGTHSAEKDLDMKYPKRSHRILEAVFSVIYGFVSNVMAFLLLPHGRAN